MGETGVASIRACLRCRGVTGGRCLLPLRWANVLFATLEVDCTLIVVYVDDSFVPTDACVLGHSRHGRAIRYVGQRPRKYLRTFALCCSSVEAKTWRLEPSIRATK